MSLPAPAAAPLPVREPRARLLNALVTLIMIISLLQGMAMLRGGAVHSNDFKHEWAGAWLLMNDLNPYDAPTLFRVAASQQWHSINPFVYLPTTGLLLRPLAGMPFAAATLVWFVLNWIIAWGVVLGGPRLLRVDRPALARLAGAAFLAGGFPFYRQMTSGQMNVVTAVLLVLAAGALIRRRQGAAGALLGLGFAWKIAPALLVAALLPLRRWRGFAVGCTISLGLLLASLGLYGWEVHRAGFKVVRQMGYGTSTWAEFQNDFYRDPANQAPNSLLHHLLTRNPYTEPWAVLGTRWANGLTLAVSLALGLAWLWALRRAWPALADANGDGTPQGQLRRPLLPLFLAATLLMLLLPSLCWDHYAVQALPALAYIFGDARTVRSPRRALLALAILVGLAIPWLYAAPPFRSGAGILLMSLRLWPLLALYAWLLCDAASTRANDKSVATQNA